MKSNWQVGKNPNEATCWVDTEWVSREFVPEGLRVEAGRAWSMDVYGVILSPADALALARDILKEYGGRE